MIQGLPADPTNELVHAAFILIERLYNGNQCVQIMVQKPVLFLVLPHIHAKLGNYRGRGLGGSGVARWVICCPRSMDVTRRPTIGRTPRRT